MGSEWRVGDTVLGVYEVTAELGRGGMGVVHRVRHLGWGIDLAVKSPHPELLRTARDREMFVREAETWVGLGLHPQLCGCHYVRTVDGVPRVFAEYVDGGSLRDWIDDGRLHAGTPEEALARILDTAAQIARGLAHAHRSGIVHQDVKSANVLLDREGTAKVTDFGLAGARHTGTFAGLHDRQGDNTLLVSRSGFTPAYASPEQAGGGVRLSRRTDVWSFGVTVLEMFTGEITWMMGPVAGEALMSFRLGEGDLRLAMPRGVGELLERCLSEDPAGRPGDLEQVADELAELYAGELGRPCPRTAQSAAAYRADELNNRAMSLLDLGRGAEAEAAFTEARSVDPQHPEAVYNQGLLSWRAGELADDALLRRLNSVRDSGDAGGRAQVGPLIEQIQQERGAGHCTGVLTGHADAVWAVALSSDGRLAVSGGEDGTVRLWDTAGGGCVHVMQGHAAAVRSVALSPDGRRALSGGHDGEVRLWDTVSGRCLRVLEGHTGSVGAVALGPDATALSGSGDGTVRWWDTDAGRCRRVVEAPPGPDGKRHGVDAARLSADGRQALILAFGAVLWDLPAGRQVGELEGFAMWPAALSRDGRHALTGGGKHGEFALVRWDLASGRPLCTLRGHAKAPYAVEMSADGRLAVSGGIEGTLRLWETATGRCLRTFDAHESMITSVGLTADGRCALTGGADGTVRLWELPEPGRHIAPLQICRPRSHTELTAYGDRAGALLGEAEQALAQGEYATAAGLVAEARALPGHERDTRALDAWHRLSLVAVRTGVQGVWSAGTVQLADGVVHAAHPTADGRRALTAGPAGVQLWDFASGQCLRTFPGRTGPVTALTLSEDERHVLAGGEDGAVRLWDYPAGHSLRVLEGHRGTVNTVAFSVDGRFAFSGGDDGTVRWWELSTGRQLREFPARARVLSVSPSRDGRFVLSCGRGTELRLWELDSGACPRLFTEVDRLEAVMGLTAPIMHEAELTADGSHLAIANADGRMQLWDVTACSRVRLFDGHVQQSGYAEPLTSLSLTPDGRFALTASWDHHIRLFDLHTGAELRALTGHTHWITSVRFAADGRYAVSAGRDGTLRRWEFDWQPELREPADWDEGARPHLDAFLTAHMPFGRPAPPGIRPSYNPALARSGTPVWTAADLEALLRHLGRAGYGWLRPEGVRAELRRAAAGWREPAALPPPGAVSSAGRRYPAWRPRFRT